MSAIIESLPVSEIGERLRIAREAAGLTQAAAAEKIDVARTTIVAIERGQRRIKTNELQGLCSLYGTSANAILRQEAVHLDMVPRFRKLAQSADDAAEQAACLLNDLVSAEAARGAGEKAGQLATVFHVSPHAGSLAKAARDTRKKPPEPSSGIPSTMPVMRMKGSTTAQTRISMSCC